MTASQPEGKPFTVPSQTTGIVSPAAMIVPASSQNANWNSAKVSNSDGQNRPEALCSRNSGHTCGLSVCTCGMRSGRWRKVKTV